VNFPVYAVFSCTHARLRSPPPPHFLYVLPVTNSTEQSAFREVAYVYSWSVICPPYGQKTFTTVLKICC